MKSYPATYRRYLPDVPADPATAYVAGYAAGRIHGSDWAVNPRHPWAERPYNFRSYARLPHARRNRAVRAYFLGMARGCRVRREPAFRSTRLSW